MTNYLVSLDKCAHTLTFDRAYLPDIGTEVWDMRCREYRHVVAVLGMYRTRCRNCRFARYHGAAEMGARHAADKHVRKCPSHTVDVSLGDDGVLSTHTGAKVSPEQLTLDGWFFDPPPF